MDYTQPEFITFKAQKDAIISTQQECYEQMKTAYYDACDEIKKMREVLEWYGDENNYDKRCFPGYTILPDQDDGERARSILSQYTKEEKK